MNTTESTPTDARQMQRLRYEFVLEASLPIVHLAENIGNEGICMRRKIRQKDGWAHVPEVTGDTMRHGMREAGAYAFLDAAGLLNNPSLSEAALRLLFAGGMVTGVGDASSVKLDYFRELSELVPTMALLGGCAQNRVIPGRLVVENALLICLETERYIPAWANTWANERAPNDTCRAHIDEVQRVRMDPTLVPAKRQLLSAHAQAEVQNRLLLSEGASATGDAIAKADTKSTMMPRRYETVAQGSLFYWACEATCFTPLDVDTFETCVWAFLSRAWVGGKRATGHGLLKPVACKERPIASPASALNDVDSTAMATKVGGLLKAHVEARRERIKSFLAEVNS